MFGRRPEFSSVGDEHRVQLSLKRRVSQIQLFRRRSRSGERDNTRLCGKALQGGHGQGKRGHAVGPQVLSGRTLAIPNRPLVAAWYCL